MLRAAVKRRAPSSASKAKEYMDARRPGARRRHHRRDPRAPRAAATPRDGFLLDGFPRTIAPGRGARRRRSSELGPHAHRRAADRGRPTTRSCARLSGRRVCARPATSTTSTSTRPSTRASATGRLASSIQRDDDKPETVRKRLERLPRADRAADRLLRGARACCGASTARASPTEVHDHIRATHRDAARLEDEL